MTTKFIPELYKEQQRHRRLCFARWCWARRNVVAPSGVTWADVFARNEGLTLHEYGERRKLDPSLSERYPPAPNPRSV